MLFKKIFLALFLSFFTINAFADDIEISWCTDLIQIDNLYYCAQDSCYNATPQSNWKCYYEYNDLDNACPDSFFVPSLDQINASIASVWTITNFADTLSLTPNWYLSSSTVFLDGIALYYQINTVISSKYYYLAWYPLWIYNSSTTFNNPYSVRCATDQEPPETADLYDCSAFTGSALANSTWETAQLQSLNDNLVNWLKNQCEQMNTVIWYNFENKQKINTFYTEFHALNTYFFPLVFILLLLIFFIPLNKFFKWF